jgi:hypothetical protein
MMMYTNIAILQKYHDEKTNPKIGKLTAPFAKAYFDDLGRARLVADLVLMNVTAPPAIEPTVTPNLANPNGVNVVGV